MDEIEVVSAGPTRQGELLASGALTSRGLTEATLAAIAAMSPSINAVVEVFAQDAMEAAADADRRRAAGSPGRCSASRSRSRTISTSRVT